MIAKKDWASSFTIFPLGCIVFCVLQGWLCTVHLYWRGGGADKWSRKLECWPWSASWPAQLEDSGPVGVIFTMMEAGKGDPSCLTWQELLSSKHLANPAACILHIVAWAGRRSVPTLYSLRPHWYRHITWNYKNSVGEYECSIWSRGRASGILGIYVWNFRKSVYIEI